jgi:hypothetical protein
MTKYHASQVFPACAAAAAPRLSHLPIFVLLLMLLTAALLHACTVTNLAQRAQLPLQVIRHLISSLASSQQKLHSIFFLLFFSLRKMPFVIPSFQPMRPLLHALLHVTSMPATAPPPPSTASPASAPVISFDVAETASPAPMLQPPSSSWGSTDLPLYTQVSPSVFSPCIDFVL